MLSLSNTTGKGKWAAIDTREKKYLDIWKHLSANTDNIY